jgi:RHS repeat-associated protein
MVHRYLLRLLGVLLGVGLPLLAAANQVPDAAELQALRQFYADTQGAGWVDNTNWLQGTTLADAASWTGVTLTNGDVTGLSLSQNQLVGSSLTALGALTALQELDLSGNQLAGTFPTALGQLTQLQSLNLSANLLTGGLPAALGQLTQLQTLILSYNQFSRGIPVVLGQLSLLQTLDLTANRFTGSIPVDLGQLAQLQFLSLSDNRLTGTLPGALGQLGALTYLDCSANQLAGTLPGELAQLPTLQYLNLSVNQFSGPLPTGLGQLSQLYYLNLSVNQLSGPLPTSLGQLAALQFVHLERNQFTGRLPAELGQWTQLIEGDFSTNQFSGALPAELAQWTALSYLQLSNNQFSGEVPAGLTQLTALQYLVLSNNQFSWLPDFSASSSLSALAIDRNQVEFGSLELNLTGPNTFIYGDFQYASQVLPVDKQVLSVNAGQPFTLPTNIGGARSHYQWQQQRGGVWQALPTATGATYAVQAAQATDAGLYRCVVLNDWATGLTLYSQPWEIRLKSALPPAAPSDDLNRNWSFSRTYDLAGNVTGEGKQFVDAMGRPTQAQTKNLAEHHVFATQTLTNAGGVSVLSTLPAPTNNQEFKYREGFVTATTVPTGGGAPVSANYAARNFEKPTGVAPDPLDDTAPGTLGYYYSTNNLWEPATAATRNPYSVSEPMAGPLGGVRRAAGPGDELALGSGRETRGREFPLLNEMDHYSRLRALFVPGSATPSLRAQGLKAVSVNANGVEGITFVNREGQTLATCLSNDTYPASTLTGSLALDPTNTAGSPVYQDLHIAASVATTLVSVTDQGPSGTPSSFVVIDLLQTPVVETAYTGAQTLSLPPGFYRLQATAGSLAFSYQVHYGNFSYVFYDDAGRPLASAAPKGLDELLRNGLDAAPVTMPEFVTTKVFDTAGRVLQVTTPDEGTTRYVYARDGRIRFSQSAVQARPATGKAPRFSYSNYDAAGRVVESGEYTQAATAGQGLVFEDMLTATPAANSVLQESLLEERVLAGGTLSTGSLELARCAQRQQVWYDRPQADAALGSRQQDFVLSAVAKTSNGQTTTWYSYDDRGQLTWLVQQAPVVGIKTVDYRYDGAGNVTQVSYQQGQPDAFYHHYAYDANQRLVQAATSTTGANQQVQARYFYYLHGPLKRVETADNLQGTDYTYTVQGWLKSINGVNRHLDGDSPANNGFGKDLFGLTLDYFAGDYRSARPGLAAPTILNAPATRYDGTVRSAAWFTAANPTLRQQVFTYDAKGQLKQADFGQVTPGSTPSAPGTFLPTAAQGYEEGNLDYDPNGNLRTLRRRDGAGVATDDFTYQYTAGTNKLAAVNNPSGVPVLDYDYDATGQLIRQRDEKGQRYLTYDVSGKVTGIYRDVDHTQPLAVFTYDDRGFRASKASYDPATYQLKQTTYSVRDVAGNELSTYVQDATTPGSPLLRSEVPLYGSSRLGTLTRLDNGTLDYRYELNDQLGSARVIYHRPTTVTEVETMELSGVPSRAAFLNDNRYRVAVSGAPSGDYVARLTNSQPANEALMRVLPVTKGDTITFSALAQWKQNASAGGTSLTPFVLAGAAAGVNALSQRGADGQTTVYPTNTQNWLSQLALGLGITLGKGAATSLGATSLQGWIKYRVLDALGNPMLDAQGQPLAGVDYLLGTGKWEYLQTGVRVPEDGTIEVTAGTSGTGEAVYFDNLRVEQTASTIVQEQHNYAFGAPMLGLNYVIGTKKYRHGYQGQFTEKDEATGTDDFELRSYDSRIGRWTAPDPAGQHNSPYVGMGNNPISTIDPDGAIPFGTFFERIISGIGLGTVSSNGFQLGMTAAFKAGAISAGVGAATTAVRVASQGPGKPQVQTASYPVTWEPIRLPFPRTLPGGLGALSLEEVIAAGAFLSPLIFLSIPGDHAITSRPLPEETITLYRGVEPNQPEYPAALNGMAIPWSAHNKGAHSNPFAHNDGNFKSIFTSWSESINIARQFAWGEKKLNGVMLKGVILKKTFLRSQLVKSPDAMFEKEWLVPGIVTGAQVLPMSEH